MITTGQSITNPVTGETLVFRKTAADTNGEPVVVETFVEPNGAVAAAHVHPAQEERFEVLAGELEFRVGKQTIVAKPGDRVRRPRRDAAPVPERRRRDRALRLRGAPGARLRAADRDDVHARRRRQGQPRRACRTRCGSRSSPGTTSATCACRSRPRGCSGSGSRCGAPLGRLLGYRPTYQPAEPEAPTALGI